MKRFLVLVLVVAACRDRDAAPAAAPAPAGKPASGSAGQPEPSGSSPSDHRDRMRPELPNAPPPIAPATGTPTADAAFLAETEDRDWRADVEPGVRKRVPHASDVECRTSTCRVTFTGKMDMLSAELDRLDTDQSLHGIAARVILGAPTDRGDGTYSINVYAKFDRAGSGR